MSQIQEFRPQVILLDQMMPGHSGAELLRELRASSHFSSTPVMMLTAVAGEDEKILALQVGADDYMTKPFSIREVAARVLALARRSAGEYALDQQVLTAAGLTLDLRAHRAVLGERELSLTLTEFKILSELMKAASGVVTRDQLRQRALDNIRVTDRTIDVHMAALRKKLEGLGERISTVRGVGYRFEL